MIYCVNRVKKEKIAGQRTAGKKAPDDVATIISEKMGGEVFHFFETDIKKNGALRIIGKYFTNKKNWSALFKKINKRDVIIIQHPYEGIKQSQRMLRKCHKYGAIIILLIHDLSALRRNIDIKESNLMERISRRAEMGSLLEADYIICHNQKMKQYLVQHHIPEEKVFCLGIFDYLCANNEIPEKKLNREVCIAGNLSKAKSGYLYKFIDFQNDYKLRLYGPNYEGTSGEWVIYEGTLPPDDLPSKIRGSFGLVWDGDDTDACTGIAGEYIKINNPHKCSLYLAANIPVIIWKQAALADYITENGLGIAVNKLEDIEEVILGIDEQQYNEMIKRVISVGNHIRNGENLTNILNEILHYCLTDAD